MQKTTLESIDPASSLLLAWKLGVGWAEKAAVLKLDNSGYSLQTFFARGKVGPKKDFLFEGSKPTNESELSFRMKKEIDGASFVRWPPGGGGHVTVLIWVFFYLASMSTSTFASGSIGEKAQIAALSVLKSQSNAIFMMKLMLLIHLVEALYVAFQLRKISMPISARVSWLLLVTFLGYPVTKQAILLNQVQSEKKND